MNRVQWERYSHKGEKKTQKKVVKQRRAKQKQKKSG